MSATGIITRSATLADAPCIATLGAQVFLDTYAIDGIRPSLVREVASQFTAPIIAALIADTGVGFILAERQNHLIAFAQFERRLPQALLPDVEAAKLNRLYVQERFTGGGVGKRLLDEVELEMAPAGAGALWLTAWVGNARALAFYPRRGYEDIGLSIYEFENERHENRIFAKRLR